MDASNTFNSLIREAALHNIRHVCPALATVLINTYRQATELFVDGSTLFFEEGITQVDPLAMPMYAMATIPFINHLEKDLKQVWYADDASAVGSLHSTRQLWDQILTMGPAFGYFPKATKTWLLTKEKFLDQAKILFQDTQVNITTHGRPYLGAALGSKEFVNQFISDRVNSWKSELVSLSDIANSKPHGAHAAFTHGYVHKFTCIPM